ncbi:class I SAM-dependent methyltransferase [Celeribacter arenosi]|uniref:rRNA adenine N-6-methyltransferase family protein n=1 Tax=Celeribacter arenosi TaxID=792649 RepID=A0ABP7KHJ7_9RHOB
MAREFATFLGEMIRNPGEVRAIAPSSRACARLMTKGVESTTGPIVEIGPGTGSFTRALLDRGVDPERLTLLELNPRFCDELRHRFPGVRILNRSAEEIVDIGLRDVGAVISGVPLLARPDLQRRVVGRAFEVIAHDGFFTQISYASTSPLNAKMRADLGITATKRGRIWANLPPAWVYEYRRHAT